MRLTLALLLTVLAGIVWSAEIQGQTPALACPAVKVEPKINNPPWAVGIAPGGACSGSIVTFRAVVSEIGRKEKPTFEWTISTGKIIDGQGTSVVKVDTEEAIEPVGATVNVRFGDIVNPECEMTASSIISLGDCHPPRPSLSMNLPTAMMQSGGLLTFSIDVSGGPPNLELKYNWQMSAGTITSGQGTPAITVDTTGLSGQAVTATVKIDGIPPECENLRSATLASGNSPPPARKYLDYGDVDRDSEEMRLAGFAIQLANEPDSLGYIYIYGPSHASKRLTRIRRFLVEKRGVDPNRISLLNGGHHEETKVELWIVPPGATLPKTNANF